MRSDIKIVGVAASPRPGQASFTILEEALRGAAQAVEGVTTDLIELAGKQINGCLACGACTKKLCCSQDDDFPPLIQTLADPALGGLILASPVYMGGLTSQAKAFLDRLVMFRRQGFMLRNKVGGALAVGGFRSGGQELTIQCIQAAMLVQDMVVVSEGMPSSHFGGTAWSGGPGGVAADEFGLATARSLGARVAELAARLHAS